MNAETCARRREALRAALRRRGLDALLVSAAPNRYYLSGFELHDPQFNESAGRLVICADGRDWLATDARYTDAAARIWDKERIWPACCAPAVCASASKPQASAMPLPAL